MIDSIKFFIFSFKSKKEQGSSLRFEIRDLKLLNSAFTMMEMVL